MALVDFPSCNPVSALYTRQERMKMGKEILRQEQSKVNKGTAHKGRGKIGLEAHAESGAGREAQGLFHQQPLYTCLKARQYCQSLAFQQLQKEKSRAPVEH